MLSMEFFMPHFATGFLNTVTVMAISKIKATVAKRGTNFMRLLFAFISFAITASFFTCCFVKVVSSGILKRHSPFLPETFLKRDETNSLSCGT